MDICDYNDSMELTSAIQRGRIYHFLRKSFSPTESFLSEFAAISRIKEFRKNEIIMQQGFPTKGEWFVEEGFIGSFLTNTEGEENCHAFFPQGTFLTVHTLRTQNERSLYCYRALEPSMMIQIDGALLMDLIEKTPDFLPLMKQVKEEETERIRNREKCLLPSSAAKKWKIFSQLYPQYTDRISHYHIASYLGITPVTLSRIINS